MEKVKPENADDYIASFPSETQKILQQVRKAIQAAAPHATEVISYGMPAFKQNKILVYFAGNKNHIGFYPTPAAVEAFKNELNDYKWSKGAIQFPLNKPMPLNLIARIVKFKAEKDLGRV